MHLLGAELLRGLGLVEALQLAVVALVERFAAFGRYVRLADDAQNDVDRLDGALQDLREHAVEVHAAQRLPGPFSFVSAAVGQWDIDPAGEAILQIPLRLAVSHEDQQCHTPSNCLPASLLDVRYVVVVYERAPLMTKVRIPLVRLNRIPFVD